jgi:hypothetical protein
MKQEVKDKLEFFIVMVLIYLIVSNGLSFLSEVYF